MDNFTFEKGLYELATSTQDCYAKALANFIFRDILEDAHSKYNISQEDMKKMCKVAVDRSALFLSIQRNPNLYKAFSVYAVPALSWDDADTENEYARNFLDELQSIYDHI